RISAGMCSFAGNSSSLPLRLALLIACCSKWPNLLTYTSPSSHLRFPRVSAAFFSSSAILNLPLFVPAIPINEYAKVLSSFITGKIFWANSVSNSLCKPPSNLHLPSAAITKPEGVYSEAIAVIASTLKSHQYSRHISVIGLPYQPRCMSTRARFGSKKNQSQRQRTGVSAPHGSRGERPDTSWVMSDV